MVKNVKTVILEIIVQANWLRNLELVCNISLGLINVYLADFQLDYKQYQKMAKY